MLKVKNPKKELEVIESNELSNENEDKSMHNYNGLRVSNYKLNML